MKASPGKGWMQVAPSVWDHASGARLHLLGCLRLPGGANVYAAKWPESRRFEFAVMVCGGNVKRGMMVWAMQIIGKGGDVMQTVEGPLQLNAVRHNIPDHQVLLAFNSDIDAEGFRYWWSVEGFDAFKKWVEAKVRVEEKS